MIDERRRRRIDTGFFMTRRGSLSSQINIPSQRNALKSGAAFGPELARPFLPKWIWRGSEEKERLVPCTGRLFGKPN
jgi:hypothetical protein